jgi:hypothetical protein
MPRAKCAVLSFCKYVGLGGSAAATAPTATSASGLIRDRHLMRFKDIPGPAYSHTIMSASVDFDIGAIHLSIDPGEMEAELQIAARYRSFMCTGPCVFRLILRHGDPDLKGKRKVFDSSPIWTLYRSDESDCFVIFEHLPLQKQTLVIPHIGERAELHFAAPENGVWNPFYGPAIELLMIRLLSSRKGAIVHSCGIAVDGNGVLLIGESGAGKSTLSRLWALQSGAKVLSDDRTVLRQINGGFTIYGTPWHGEAKYGNPGRVELKRIFFLRHGSENQVQSLSVPEVMQRLLQCSFAPFWDAGEMDKILALLGKVAACIPASELKFVPGQQILELIRQHVRPL